VQVLASSHTPLAHPELATNSSAIQSPSYDFYVAVLQGIFIFKYELGFFSDQFLTN